MIKNNFAGKWAIVTGASKGLGYCYTEELLKLGLNVVGVARNTSSLQELAKKYPEADLDMINLDLSDVRNCDVLYERVNDRDVAYLVNNAGYGVWGYFTDSDLEQEMNMVDLNIKSLHILTKKFLQKFEQQGYGRILNIGSTAAFVPAPVFASYYASKAYVYSLGAAIDFEQKKKKSPARVITICPGPLKTDFWNRSSNQKDAKYASKVHVMRTDVFAKKSLKKAMRTKKSTIIIGSANHAAKWFATHMPRKAVLNAIYNYQKKRK